MQTPVVSMWKTMALAFLNRTGRKCLPPLPGWMTAAPAPPAAMVWGFLSFAAFSIGMVGRRLSGAATSWAVPGSAWSGRAEKRQIPFYEPVLAASPDVTNLYRTATEPVGRLVNNRKRKG